MYAAEIIAEAAIGDNGGGGGMQVDPICFSNNAVQQRIIEMSENMKQILSDIRTILIIHYKMLNTLAF